MGKFNLKKILISDYEIDLVQATNFEQWVGKNMDYEAIMEKDFKNVSFKSSETNKKDFLKNLKTRALKLDPTKSIKDILGLFEENESKIKNTELYDEIRKLKLELTEKKETIDNQTKQIKELTNKKETVYIVNEVQEKIINEYNALLRGFDLGFDLKEYEKAVGKLTFNRHVALKELLTNKGVDKEILDNLLVEWKDKQIGNFEKECSINVNFKNYEEKREELREQFKFIRENREFINTIAKLKGIEIVFDKKQEESGWVLSTQNHLANAKKAFIAGILGNGKFCKTSWCNATLKVYGTTNRATILNLAGIKYRVLDKQGDGQTILVFEPLEDIIKKINKKTIEILKNK